MPEASGSGVTDESDYSTFENKTGLAEDMKFLARMPELCDVTFLVGDTREPVCAVKAVLAARSRVFHKMLYQAPSPQRKKEPPTRENKIRMFLKRSSEPLLNLQNAAQQPNQHPTIIIEEFEPDVFRQVIEYIHTGCIMLQPRTLLGVMNAADYYGLNQLRSACAGFVQCCITVDTVCSLLASAERYIQYKCTKSLVQKVLEFVIEHGNEVLNLGSFTLLPQHVVLLILAREELRADEFTKFQAALMWSKKFCDSNQSATLKEVMANFLEYIQFHKIPTNVLMKEIHPLDLVPPGIIMNALAYQADPSSVDPDKHSPHRVIRQDRGMSCTSSPDQYDSKTTLSSSGSDAGSDQKQHSGKNSTAEQESIGEQSQPQTHHHHHHQQHQPRQETKSPKQQEEEDLQKQIEQRIQLQLLRQEQELKRQIEEAKMHEREEELKRQLMDEDKEKDGESRYDEKETKKQQEKRKKSKKSKKELKKEQKKKEQDEAKELKRQQEEEELLNKLEAEITKKQKQEEEFMKARQREEDLMKSKQREEELERSRQREEESKRQKEQDIQQREQSEKMKQKEGEEKQQDLAPKTPENELALQEQKERLSEVQSTSQDEQSKKVTELKELSQQEKEEQQRMRKDMRLQLQLQDLKVHSAVQQQIDLQKQDDALMRQIQEKRREEELESQDFQLLQLYLEGRKPESEKIREERQARDQQRKEKKKKEDRVKVRVKNPETQKQAQQEQPQEQPIVAPRDEVSGFYIRLVVTQGGGRNLVWLFKTHMF
ncbi:uncharacterized protein LOC143353287 isoform X2 [Halictus rubicundus]|uniref:uncharacterized protein LOC143353287 isoform X2 n=1 Tax=Halictus rubicundus TaxID=77578 RepID=UPI0040354B11